MPIELLTSAGRVELLNGPGGLIVLSRPGRVELVEASGGAVIEDALLTEAGEQLLTEDGDILEWE